MDLDIRAVLRSQHHAALDMLAAAIEACPDDAWNRPSDANRSWQLAYHTVFFVHLYLQPSEVDFRPWGRHEDRFRQIGRSHPDHPDYVDPGEPLAQADLLDYLAFARTEVDRQMETVDLHAESGFSWLPMSKLELQMYSMRHTMQHAGELYERIAKTSGADLPWVGMGKE